MAGKALAVGVTPALLELFRARHLYHRPYSGDRWKVSEPLRLREDTRVEPFSHIHQGGHIPASLGAFTYVRSNSRPNVHIGRYCSIGAEIRWLEDDHSHSVTGGVSAKPIKARFADEIVEAADGPLVL